MKNAASFLKIKPITATQSEKYDNHFNIKVVIQSIAITAKAFRALTLLSFIKFPACKTDLQTDGNSFNTQLNIPTGGYIIVVYIILLCKRKLR